MTTLTKRNIAGIVLGGLTWLNIFSNRLGLTTATQVALWLAILISLGLAFFYGKQLRQTKTVGTLSSDTGTATDLANRQKKTRRVLIMVWILMVAVALASPLWMPITGVTNGTRVDSLTGVFTAVVISVIFGLRFKKIARG